jgi:iron(III) transport system permease protein
VLAGLGTLWMFLGTPFFRPVYGTALPLLFVSILGGMTLATQITKASLLQLGRELEEASRMSGGGWWHTYRHIVLPLLAPTLVTIAVLKFMFVAQAASSIILIANSETRTLSLLTLDFMTSGLYGAATVNALVIMALVTGVALVARRFGLRLGIHGA